jgi:hypothetical protein
MISGKKIGMTKFKKEDERGDFWKKNWGESEFCFQFFWVFVQFP